MNCIFCKIISGEIPSSKIYEDDRVYVFLDIQPINKGHALVIPKTHSENLLDMKNDDLNAVFGIAKRVANVLMIALNADGFNIGMNNYKAAGQLVMHTHVHVIPRFFKDGLKHWPGKEYSEGEIDDLRNKIVKFL